MGSSTGAIVDNVLSLTVRGVARLGNSALVADPVAGIVAVGSNIATYLGGGASVAGTLDVGASANVAGALTVAVDDLTVANGRVGICCKAPRQALEVAGSVLSSAGTLGPMFALLPPTGYTDVRHLSQLVLNSAVEPGNPATGGTGQMFSGALLGCDASADGAVWTRARLIVRGCLIAPPPYQANPYSTLTVQRYTTVHGCYMLATQPFVVPFHGTANGYQFVISPWFQFQTGDQFYALLHSALDEQSVFRFGSVHIQFA